VVPGRQLKLLARSVELATLSVVEVERQLRERVEAIDEEFDPIPAAPDPTAGP
jgi:hypothetical protein